MCHGWALYDIVYVGVGFGWIGVGWVVLVCVRWKKLNISYYLKTLISFHLRGTRYCCLKELAEEDIYLYLCALVGTLKVIQKDLRRWS